MRIVVHYEGSQSAAEQVLLLAVSELDPEVTISRIQSYQSLIQQPVKLVNAANTIFLWCGIVALFLLQAAYMRFTPTTLL